MVTLNSAELPDFVRIKVGMSREIADDTNIQYNWQQTPVGEKILDNKPVIFDLTLFVDRGYQTAFRIWLSQRQRMEVFTAALPVEDGIIDHQLVFLTLPENTSSSRAFLQYNCKVWAEKLNDGLENLTPEEIDLILFATPNQDLYNYIANVQAPKI